LRGTSYANIRFGELTSLLESVGFQGRCRGNPESSAEERSG
jgi:hypothetical protein